MWFIGQGNALMKWFCFLLCITSTVHFLCGCVGVGFFFLLNLNHSFFPIVRYYGLQSASWSGSVYPYLWIVPDWIIIKNVSLTRQIKCYGAYWSSAFAFVDQQWYLLVPFQELSSVVMLQYDFVNFIHAWQNGICWHECNPKSDLQTLATCAHRKLKRRVRARS